MKLLALVVALVACTGGPKPAPTTPPPGGGDTPVGPPPSGGDTPVASPPGGGDTPVASPPGGGDTPVASPNPDAPVPANSPLSCEKRIRMKCMQGADGCESSRTLFHVCVPTGAKAGPGCDKEIALQCPTGQTDACLHTPQLAKNHICTYR